MKMIKFCYEDFSEVKAPVQDADARIASVMAEKYIPNRDSCVETDGGKRFTFAWKGKNFHAYYED